MATMVTKEGERAKDCDDEDRDEDRNEDHDEDRDKDHDEDNDSDNKNTMRTRTVSAVVVIHGVYHILLWFIKVPLPKQYFDLETC